MVCVIVDALNSESRGARDEVGGASTARGLCGAWNKRSAKCSDGWVVVDLSEWMIREEDDGKKVGGDNRSEAWKLKDVW